MSDIADKGNDTAELFNNAALSQRKPEGPKATGFCLNCGAVLYLVHGEGHRWCDADCRDDWEKDNNRA